MKVQVLKYPTEDDWLAVKQRALVTIGKTPVNPPDMDWKIKMLKCRHSPIRYLQFSFLIEDLPYWVHVELVRHHIGVQFYVKSQRSNPNRGECRQDVPVTVIMDVNADALMTIMNKRLCGRASNEIQELMLLIREQVLKTNEEFAHFLIPPCYGNGICREFCSCKGKNIFYKES